MKKLTFIAAILMTANLLFAQIINIPDDYPTIQQGINAASNGDTVLVAPDTYFENIIFNGKNITLASYYLINPDTSLISQTIIDGCQNSSVVEMDAGTLNGFTITNGYAHMGGGILCCCSVNSLVNLIICNNTAYWNPGVGAPGYGGGICLEYDASPTIENVVIKNNNGIAGGGIFCGNNSTPLLKDITIENNTAGLGTGGGVYCCSSSVLLVFNSSISNNSAIMGGGIYSYVDNIIRVTNSILWENSPQEIYLDEQSYYSSSIEVSYSDIQGGEAGIVTNGNVTINWLEGNIDEDPLFEGTSDHPYMLSNESPCINTGTPDTTGLNLPELDLAGNPRIYGGRIDMGAYENQEVVVTTNKSIHQILSTDIEIHPNPARNEIFVSVKDGVIIKEANIYNQMGQKVLCKKGKTNTVDVSMLQHGMYIIEIEIDNGKLRSKLIIE